MKACVVVILIACFMSNDLNHVLAINASDQPQIHTNLTQNNAKSSAKNQANQSLRKIETAIDHTANIVFNALGNIPKAVNKFFTIVNTFVPFISVILISGTIIGCIIFPCVMVCLGFFVSCIYCSEVRADTIAAKDLEKGNIAMNNRTKDVDKKKVSKDMTTAKTTKTTADDAESKDNVVPPALNNNGVAVETIIHRPMT